MKWADGLEDALGHALLYFRALAELMGSNDGGIFLSQCRYWQRIANKDPEHHPDGWWFKTQAEWWEEARLSRKILDSVRGNAKELGVLEERRTGSPPRTHYRFNGGELLRLLVKAHEGGRLSSPELSQGDNSNCPAGTNRIVPNGQLHNKEASTTSKTTSTIASRENSKDHLEASKEPTQTSSPDIDTGQDLIPWMEKAWRGHPTTRKRKFPKNFKYPESVAAKEEAAGKESFRKAFLLYLDSSSKPDIFEFLRSQETDGDRRKGSAMKSKGPLLGQGMKVDSGLDY